MIGLRRVCAVPALGASCRSAAVLLGCLTAAWVPGRAQTAPRLVVDLAPGHDPDLGSRPGRAVGVGSQLFFAASSSWTGRELWVLEPPSSGARLVADLAPGTSGSFPAALCELNGRLLFRALDETGGGSLWSSDGTARGTVRITALSGFPEDGGPLVRDGSLVWGLAGAPGVARPALVRSDGTTAGTTVLTLAMNPVKDSLVPIAGMVLFIASEAAHGYELWRSDGTPGGTAMIADINPGPASAFPYQALPTAVAGGVLFLAADDGTRGRELWRSDGTAAGTFLVRDVNPGAASGVPGEVYAASGRIWFRGDDGTSGAEPWCSDGTAAGTRLVADLAPGSAGSFPGVFAELGTAAVFGVATVGPSRALYRSDGSAAGTVLLRDFGYVSTDVLRGAVALGGELLFDAPDATSETELWKTDGSPAGTTRVRDINPGAPPSRPADFVAHQGVAYFSANDGMRGQELWRSDGSTAGTQLAADVEAQPRSLEPRELTGMGELLFFSARDTAGGARVWSSDGTAAGTRAITPPMSGTTSNEWFQLTPVGARLFFGVSNLVYPQWRGLWTSDGTVAGTRRLRNLYPGQVRSLMHLTDVRGTLLFQAYAEGSSTTELWRSDGTDAGTVVITSCPRWMSSLDWMQAFRGGLLFAWHDAAHGIELWWSDGTAAGTRMVHDLLPGPGNGYPQELGVIDGVCLFRASDGQGWHPLWRTDGTAAGTWQLSTVRAEPYAATAGGQVFFAGYHPAQGQGLWASDGTVAGTRLVRGMAPGLDPMELEQLTAHGDLVLFSARDPLGGRELWRSDGTASGTFRVRDCSPGPGSGIYLRQPTSYWTDQPFVFSLPGADRALFAAADPEHRLELWQTAPRAGDARRVTEQAPGALSFPVQRPVLAGGRLFLVASTPATGPEIWSMDSLPAAVPYGHSCAAVTSPAPQIQAAGGAPVPGNAAFRIDLTAAPAGRPAMLLGSLRRGAQALAGTCRLWLDETSLLLLGTTWTEGTGRAWVPLPLPVDPGLMGAQVFAQFLVADDTMTAGVAASSGLEVLVR